MEAIHVGDVREVLPTLPSESVQCVVTSPPYWGLRDYGVVGQLGLEETPEEYVENIVAVFREVRRVLRDDGTLWLNLGDSYNNRSKIRSSSHQPSLNGFVDSTWRKDAERGRVRMSATRGEIKEKDLVGIPWMVAFALRTDGWYLRSDIIWAKPNPMPESVTDRPTKAHEYLFLLTKSPTYYYDADAISEPVTHGERFHGDYGKPGVIKDTASRNGRLDFDNQTTRRNRRTVWTVATQPYPDAHFATFPEDLVEPCILAGSPVQGVVLDPFAGSGTTLAVAKRLDRQPVGIELNPAYVPLIRARCRREAPQMRLLA